MHGKCIVFYIGFLSYLNDILTKLVKKRHIFKETFYVQR